MTDVTAGSDGTLSAHPLRAAVLGELHARPFTPIRTPARVLHFGFIAGGAQSDRATHLELCRVHGIAAPPADAKYHRSPFNGGTMRWESHSEFSTYRWELAATGTTPFEPPTSSIEVPMARAAPRGALLVAIDLHLIADPDRAIALERIFDRSSLAAAENSDGTGLFATDFQPGADGFVRIIVADRGLGPERAGALVQRVLELETYRTLALLGLPEAQRLSPSVNRIEKRLAEVTDAMRRTTGLTDNNRLLDELTTLASELEADSAASLFRFGATRAYYEIVQGRVQAIGEHKVGGLPTWSSFLLRRMAPAMRTCQAMEERQENLARKLSRTTNLLRTRVDVAVEQQNRDLLTAMNRRARLQLRLQQTVEGLSVAAISYYTVGLINYILKGAKDAGSPIDPTIGTAISVPIVVLLVALIVRRIRRRYGEQGDKDL
jgi:uncharacterized membrane-anchored protein